METLKSKVKRMVDANFNRAREGLRVVEDVARFVLDNDELSNRFKQLRSNLTDIEKDFDFIQFRDTINDVGTKQSSKIENTRSSLIDIVTANMKRVEESLRVLEEVFKLIDVEVSMRLKNMRYEAYTLEKQVVSLLKE